MSEVTEELYTNSRLDEAMGFEEFKEKLKTVMNYYKLNTQELNLAKVVL